MADAASSGLITTADIFDALTADRPYRAALPASQALAMMSEMVGTQVDPKCFEALRRRSTTSMPAWPREAGCSFGAR
jgi:HD-GYP domain-containing protein (c-di-GMP phosphodiesterase class II)